MNISLLVNLTSKAWSLKILALLHEGVPGRQAPLLAASRASRSSFTTSLDHLCQLGLLERNPGHGHPLRPEFRLTAPGKIIAAQASQIIQLTRNDSDFTLIRRSWTLPILAVTTAPQRFSQIRTDLNRITDRALSQSLTLLEDHCWIQREIDLSERTPYPTYQAINIGQQINQTLSGAIETI